MEDDLKEKIKNYRLVANNSEIEEIVRSEGWTNLKWGSPNPDSDSKDTGWKLYACPPNYDGPYSDYSELVVRQREDKVGRNRLVTYEAVGNKLPKRIIKTLKKYIRVY